MIKYLSTIVLTVALCCACDGEDFSADPTLMPPATQTGANTFGCLIDGWVYTGQRYGPDHKASYYPAYNEDEKATVHVYVWVDDNTSISFNIIDPKEKNITVTNVPAYGTSSVAQAVFALLLELTNRTGHHSYEVRNGRWSSSPDFSFWDFPLVELHGKTLCGLYVLVVGLRVCTLRC